MSKARSRPASPGRRGDSGERRSIEETVPRGNGTQWSGGGGKVVFEVGRVVEVGAFLHPEEELTMVGVHSALHPLREAAREGAGQRIGVASETDSDLGDRHPPPEMRLTDVVRLI